MKNFQLRLNRIFPFAIAITILGLSSCKDVTEILPEPGPQNVLWKMGGEGDLKFNTLLTGISRAGLENVLSEAGPFTVFAPTNESFQKFFSTNNLSPDKLFANPNLADILTYHVVSGNVTSDDVMAGPVTSLSGDVFYVSIDPEGDIWINGNTMITDVDRMASNGVIHTLDYVITPPTMSIAEIAVENTTASTPEFTQLVAALTRAGLVDAVSGGTTDNLTVFAPTDAAFEDLYTSLGVSGVDEIDVDLLTDVLLYHVVPSRAFSQDLRDGASLPTLLEGNNLSVDLPGLMINESELVPSMLNIHATNGVIHVIDKVLVP